MTGFPGPIADADWPQSAEHLLSGFAGGLNVYRTMAHHPALLRAWSDLREHIVNATALGPELSEVAILRLGHRLSARYEWVQHVVRGHARGLTIERIISIGGPLDGMVSEDALICEAIDQLLAQACIRPELARRLIATLGTEALFDLMATAGFYSTLGFILKTFDVPLEEDIVVRFQELTEGSGTAT